MKIKKIITAFLLLVALLLSACQINTITEINPNGSGIYKFEMGLTAEDQTALADFGSTIDDFCSDMGEDMPVGATFYKETRNETETWCIFEVQFQSLAQLEEAYNETDTRINRLEFSDGKFFYDLTIDMSGDAETEGMDIEMFWIVKMPGKVLENNASQQSDTTLTWQLKPGQENNIYAISEEKSGFGPSFDIDFGDGSPIIAGVVGVLFLCLCCFIPLVLGGVAFFLIRKKKNTQMIEPGAPMA